jgi:hypothetical protein
MFWDVPYLPFLSMTAQDGRAEREEQEKCARKDGKSMQTLVPCALTIQRHSKPIRSEINDDWSRYSLHLKHPVVPEDVTFTISATIL